MENNKKNLRLFFVVLFCSTLLLINYSCSSDKVAVNEISEEEEEIVTIIDDTDFEATDWTTETHSKDVNPNFDEVFQDNTVKRIDIVIAEERWEAMMDNMTELFGAFGSDSGSTGGGPGGGMGNLFGPDEDPLFVPAEVFYNDIEWYRVGVRFKGNSSLKNTWGSGSLKLSFKLDFDEFEDSYPQIDDQRFYGLKKLHLKNNYFDDSMLREKVAADVFNNFGLASPLTAFYTVYVDYGDGPIYFGLYTMVEDIEDTVLETYFSSDEGNLYKPEGDAASFEQGTFNEEEYEKKTNEDEGNYSDVSNLLSVINDNSRTTDPTTWRANLEAIFDTDVFLKYLAANTVIQNWDTYGKTKHNYYLYNNPNTNKLTWIPWDNNESLQEGRLGGSLPLDFLGLSSSSWPLIGYLYEDEVYKAKYEVYLQELVDDAFSVNNIQSQYATYSTLIESYATSELDGYTVLSSSSAFYSEVNKLNTHVSERVTDVNDYLGD